MKKEEVEDAMSPESPNEISIFASPEAENDDDNKSQKSYRGSGNVTVDNAEDYVER